MCDQRCDQRLATTRSLLLLLLSATLSASACIDPDSDTPPMLRDAGTDANLDEAGSRAGEGINEAGSVAGSTSGESAGDLAGAPAPITPPPARVSVATYNVQNLFDFIDDPERSEGEFTPNTSTWSRGAYTAKVESIAEAIILIDADIVTLQEVESDEVLLELTQLIRQRGGRDYAHVATSSTRDQRGIRLGVLSIYPITREIGRPISESVSCANGEMLDGSRPEARPIYEVNLWSDGSGGGGGGGAQSLTLLVNHWKSRAFDVPCRVTEHHKRGALQIRDLVREWTDSDPERAVLVLGDFNATEDEEALSATLDATLSRSGDEEGRILLNLWGEAGVRAGDPTNVTTGTYRYQGAWLRLDHIFATSSMMSAGTSVWSVESFEQIRANELMLDGSPYYWSNDRREGYSDHLPLKVTLRLR